MRFSAWVGMRAAPPRSGGGGSEACAAGLAQAEEIVAGMIGGAGQGRGRNEKETLALGQALQRCEFLRGDEALDRRVLGGRLQILPDREEIDAGGAQIIHNLLNLLALLPQADHQPGFGEERWVERLHPVEKAQGGVIARAG